MGGETRGREGRVVRVPEASDELLVPKTHIQ